MGSAVVSKVVFWSGVFLGALQIIPGSVHAQTCESARIESRRITFKWQASSKSTPGESLIVLVRVAGNTPGSSPVDLEIHPSPYFPKKVGVRMDGSPTRWTTSDSDGKWSVELPVQIGGGEPPRISVVAALFGKPYANLELDYSLEFLTDEGLPSVEAAHLQVDHEGKVDSQLHRLLF